MNILQTGRGARLDTPLGVDVLVLQSASFDEELSSGFMGNILALSEDKGLDARALVGELVTVTLDTTAGPRFFNGHVSSFLFAGMRGEFAAYRLTVVPWMHVLSLRSDCRIHMDMTVPEIIEETIGRSPFSDRLDMTDLSSEYVKREFCVQYNETTSDFLFRLMQEEGIVSTYRHEEDGHTLVLSDWSDQFKAVPGYEVIDWFPPDRQSREIESISHWVWTNKMSSGAYASNDYDFKAPGKSLLTQSEMPDAHKHDDGEIYHWPGGYIEPKHGEQLALIRRESMQAYREFAQAQSDAAGLRPGHTFTLSGFPRDSENKPWLVTRISHDISGLDYASGGGGAAEYINSFDAYDPELLYRPASSVPRPKILGAQTAVVTGPEDEEISTDEYGRITVSFPWDRHGPKDANSSCWIRVAQSWAGPGWGAQYIPRIGQEVVVEFIDGNPDKPIITGCVYNGKNKPPFELPQNKTQSGLRTDTHKGTGFNELSFEDEKGREKIYLHAEHDHELHVENNRSKRVDRNQSESVGNNKSIEVGNNHQELIGGNMTLMVGPNRLQGAVTKAFSKFTRSIGDMASSLGLPDALNMGEGNLIVGVGKNKAETVMVSSTEIVGAGKALTIGGGYQTVVGGIMNTSVGIGALEEIGQNKSIVVGKIFELVVGKSKLVKTEDGRIDTTGVTITVNAEEKFEVVVGKSKLTMLKDGTIDLTGKDITINGSKTVVVEGGKSVDVKASKINLN